MWLILEWVVLVYGLEPIIDVLFFCTVFFFKSLWRKWMGKNARLFFTLIFACFLRHIAELIFYMEELRAHVRKYGPVMQRYYVQYLSGFDAVVLNELVQVRLSALWIHFLLTALKERTQISHTSLWEQLLFVVLSWDEDQSCVCSWVVQTWTLVTLWIIHRISHRASRRTWGEIYILHH